ncbi:MAG: 4-vinyl reductase [Alphaproteobacteria bacterium]|nr:4-vinyl reductase [Alphaproteobacteria bacterium]
MDRLVHDTNAGEIRDGDIRYLMFRTDAVMGLFKRLPEAARRDALAALADSIEENGGRSAAAYRASGAAGAALLDVIVETAPQLGWGTWSFVERRADRLVLEVRNSPFVHGFGGSALPICAPIVGMLRVVSSMVLGAPTAVEETVCAAQSPDVCRFIARRRR